MDLAYLGWNGRLDFNPIYDKADTGEFRALFYDSTTAARICIFPEFFVPIQFR